MIRILISNIHLNIHAFSSSLDISSYNLSGFSFSIPGSILSSIRLHDASKRMRCLTLIGVYGEPILFATSFPASSFFVKSFKHNFVVSTVEKRWSPEAFDKLFGYFCFASWEKWRYVFSAITLAHNKTIVKREY